MTEPFILEVTYNAPIDSVWRTLTETGRMREWYFPQLIEFKPVVGFDFRFKNDGSAFQKEWKVTKVDSGHSLAHTWIYTGYPGTSEVSFELFEEGNKTRLKLTHSGLETFPKDPHFARRRFEDGWARIIGVNLKNIAEDLK